MSKEAEAMSTEQDSTLTGLVGEPLPYSRQVPGAILFVVTGPNQGRELRLSGQEVAIGSAPDCDLVLGDPTVSRHHLTAYCSGSLVRLTDQDSKNGSFYDGRRFQRIDIGFGDLFTVGETLIKVIPTEEPLDAAASPRDQHGGLVGTSVVMRRLFTLIDQVAIAEATVLIEGETGVGKELVAEEIHLRSSRRDGPFVVFDCGSVPGELIESALFGHVRGAFTGAITDRIGVFQEADGGTILLDEIGELKSELQPTLLRVLERGVIRPVGASKHRPVNVRVLAATHRDLAGMVNSGSFREDLYYRLAVIRLLVPPLRERPEDIPQLVRHFLNRLGRGDLLVAPEVLEQLSTATWPGNVRELRNAVHRGVILARNGSLPQEAIMGNAFAQQSAAGTTAPTPALRPGVARKPFRMAKAEAIETFEHQYLSELVEEYETISACAEAADMDRRHLRTLLRRHGLIEK